MWFTFPTKRLPDAIMMALAGSLLLSGCGEKSARNAGESVSYSRTTRIRGLDPGISGEVSSSLAISRIYEGLLQYDYLERPYKVIPLLAESMPEISEDGLEYIFKLREGIYFQDDPCFPDGKGRALVAEDFIYSIKRVADVKNGSSGFWAFNNRIKGINDFRDASKGAEPTDYSMVVEGLTALDDHTLRITLVEPYPQLLYILTMHYSFAVPREAVERYGETFVNHPVGTGPYRLVEWTRNSRIEFERNPKWAETGRVDRYPTNGTPEQVAAGLLEDAGKPIPFIDRVIQYVIEDSTTAWMMFLSGQLDVSAVSRDNFEAVITTDKSLDESLATRGIDLITAPTLDLYYLGFNWEDPVVGDSADPERALKNRKLRQALSCAYDFEQMNRFMNGRLFPLGGPIPAPLAGSREEPSPYEFNLEKARRLLAEAGYPDGVDPNTGKRLELTIEMGGASSDIRQRMELMTDMFSKINVVLNVSYNTWPAFIEKMNRRQGQLFQLGWVADYPDAENFLQLFYSQNESPGPNHSNYRNEEIDRMYTQIRVMLDSPERTKIYDQMSEIIIEDCPWIFMFQPMDFSLTQSWFGNYVNHAFPYGMGKYRRVTSEVRSEWLKRYGDDKLDMKGSE